MKLVATNRKARHDYEILDIFEAGLVLKGSEVKSLRTKNCSIEESFALVENGEVVLYNMHIPEFEKASYFKAEPTRKRKLLLNKKEIKRINGLTMQKGLTIIPLRAYFNDKGFAKMEIALAKGRKIYDKRKKLHEEITRKEIKFSLNRKNI
jgi:SsrA-binding protein